jgi:EmrB/QacA subfamily drug resistance transporter
MEWFILAKSKPGVVMAAIMTGTFLVPVNSTMIAVGLPTIAEALHSSIAHASWIITVYLIVMAAVQPIAGKLGDIYGNRNMFLLGMLLFLFASIACMFSANLLWLILFRAMQAVAGALAAPNASALIRFTVPKERLAKTFGTFGLLMGLGAAVGPLAGSLLISAWGWTSIFWVNIPFALYSLAAVTLTLSNSGKRSDEALDLLGSLYLVVGLTTLVLAITHADFVNLWTILLLALSTLLFIRQEMKYRAPLIQFSLFRQRTFAGANLAILLSNAVMYSTILVMPIWLQSQFHYSVKMVGILLFVFSLAMSLCSKLGGHLSDWAGKRNVISLSFLISAVALVGYLGIYLLPVPAYIIGVLLIGGIGSGLGTAAMQSASLQTVPKEMSGIASGIYSTFRYVGGMIASVLVGLLGDYHLLFYCLLVLAVAGLPLSLGLFEKEGGKTLSTDISNSA